jgi:hypothetical protein
MSVELCSSLSVRKQPKKEITILLDHLHSNQSTADIWHQFYISPLLFVFLHYRFLIVFFCNFHKKRIKIIQKLFI